MPKTLITILLALLLAGGAWPQEDETDGDTDTSGGNADTEETADDADEETAGESDEADEGNGTDVAVDDSDLDLQTYEEDDDDFVPTEEIPADAPIPFPSNI